MQKNKKLQQQKQDLQEEIEKRIKGHEETREQLLQQQDETELLENQLKKQKKLEEKMRLEMKQLQQQALVLQEEIRELKQQKEQLSEEISYDHKKRSLKQRFKGMVKKNKQNE